MSRSTPEAAIDPRPLLEIDGLRTWFATRAGTLRAVDGVDLSIGRGEVVGLVGESGSGKSVTGYSIMGLVEPPGHPAGGSIRFDGQELVGMEARALRALRGRRIAMVFQDPMLSLNPVLRIDTQMVEAIRAHEPIAGSRAFERCVEALEAVGIAAARQRLAAYPHELSGGMRQRIAIAIALLNNPELLIADEPTTALDVTLQGQILALVQSLVRRRGTALLWITHDLSVVAGLADRVCVMYAGRIVESGPVDAVLDSPLHPYTRGLIASVPTAAGAGRRLPQLRGHAPTPMELPPGCAFRPRCDRATPECAMMPELLPASGSDRQVRCHHPLPAGAPAP